MVQVRSGQRKVRNNIQNIQIDKPILIVEDQASLAKMLKELLFERYGAEVHLAKSYAEAKNYLSKYRHEYHVVICDLNLPDAANGEIVDLVNRAKVKMIALTGTFGEKMRETMVKKGVIDYITKDSINAYEYVVNLVGRLYENYSTKLLIVEDSMIARKLVQHMLELQNFNVLLAGNGKEALTVLEENPDVKLVLTDYNMPEMNGFDLTLDLRKHHLKEQLAVIGLSATGNNELGAQFIKNGANDFLTKPVSYEELLCRINQNIDMLVYMEALRNAAHRDFLTNLYNRRYFFNEGKDLYNASVQDNKPVAVAMLDIDLFKQVNDNYGHEIGDDILVFFSNALTTEFTDHIVARIGGEEFVVLLTDTELEQALDLMNKFRQNIADTPLEFDEHTINVSVSIGLHHLPEENLDAMLKIADENLYVAKQNGRNRVITSSEK